MRRKSCHLTAGLLVDLELGLLEPARQEALRLHLHDCAGCASVARRERVLTRDLRALRGDYPHELDLAARILGDLDRVGPVRRDDLSTASLGWAAAAAIAFSVMLAASFWLVLPELIPDGTRGLQRLMALASGAAGLGSALLSILAIPLKLLAGLAGTAIGLLARTPWQPLTLVAIAGGYAMMAAVITAFVRRDFKQPGAVYRTSS